MVAILREGWTDGEYNYFKGKSEGKQCWFAIDKDSGMSFCKGATKNHIYEKAHSEAVQKDLAEHKKTEKYKEQIKTWYKLLVKCGAIMEV